MAGPAERKKRASRVVVLVLALTTVGFTDIDARGQGGRTGVQASIRSVRTETDKAGATIVVIEANGSLPEPSSGVPASPPPRIYLDFTDVLPSRTIEPVTATAVVRAVRVAEHNATPLVTRVVIDLVKSTAYRVDVSVRNQGRVVVVLSGPPEPSASSPARPQQARPTTPTTSTPAQQPRGTGAPATPPPKESERAAAPPSAQSPQARGRSGIAENQYGVRVSSALLRLYALRPLLEAIDRRADTVPGDLDAAAKEFDAVAKLLSGIKPPSTREGTHALLLRTCTLGARAVRMRQQADAMNDPAPGWDAASAAAGALMMFDRANGDLAAK